MQKYKKAVLLGSVAWLTAKVIKASIETKEDCKRDPSNLTLNKVANCFYNNLCSRTKVIDDYLRDKVTPQIGSVVVCDLAVAFEHSGIYIGNNKIIHRDGGGFIDIVTPDVFLKRLNGLNNAMSIYVSCKGNTALHLEEVAKRAIEAKENPNFKGYDILSQNCHQFVQYALTGKVISSKQNFVFANVEQTLKNLYQMDNWRIWDFEKNYNVVEESCHG